MASTPRDTSYQPKNPICQSADESVKIICDRHGQNTTLEYYFSHAQRKEEMDKVDMGRRADRGKGYVFKC